MWMLFHRRQSIDTVMGEDKPDEAIADLSTESLQD